MTSSQPVATPNALNFTPDNKHCYAYSGIFSVADTETTLIQFNTQSEYIVASIIFNSQTNEKNFSHKIYFNDVVVQEFLSLHSGGRKNNDLEMIIPPFTDVKLTSDNVQDGSAKNQIVSLIGKAYGMSDVGYQ